MQATVPRTPAPELPRRISLADSAKSGIELNHTPAHVAFAQRWAYHAARSGDRTNSAVATAAVVLVENAHAHTRSGLPGGGVRLVLTRGPFLLALEVTDDGPRPGQARYPLPRTRPDRTGLRLVEHLTIYWDWEGTGGGPLTVRAMFELP